MNPPQPRSSHGKQAWQDRGRLVPPAPRGPSVARTQAVGAAVAAVGRLGPLRRAPAGTGPHSTGLGWGGLAGKPRPSSVNAESSWILLNALQFVASRLIDLQGL